jgi:hypothetical protein
MKKRAAISIQLRKGEGMARELPKQRITLSDAAPEALWSCANILLRQWATTCSPAAIGYDKTDFTITYEDGETYEGSLDLKHPERGKNESLEGHIRDHCLYSSGQKMPETMQTLQEWQAFLLKTEGQESMAAWANWLSRYQIGPEECVSDDVIT